MNLTDKPRLSIYVILAAVIVVTVSVLMAAFGWFSFRASEGQLLEHHKKQGNLSLRMLEGNLPQLIASYAVNDYLLLLKAEAEARGYLGLVLEDYQMEKIFGPEAAKNGFVHRQGNELEAYTPKSTEQAGLLKNAFFQQELTIYTGAGHPLGRLTIYHSDRELQLEKTGVIKRVLLEILAESVFLILTLFLSIRYLLFRHVFQIIYGINNTDEDGLPKHQLTLRGPQEVYLLAQSINGMTQAARRYQKEVINTQESLRQEKERFQLAIDGTLDGLWDWDLVTGRVFHSPRFERMLGYEIGELPDTIACWRELLHPEDREQAEAKVQDYLAAPKESPYEHVFRMRRKSGGWSWINGRGKAVFDAAGKPLRFVGFNTDVTNHYRLIEEHQQARLAAEQASEAKSRFLSMMSHELRTPMNGVLGMAQLLQMSDLDEDQKMSVEVILSSGSSLVKILSSILDFAKLEANKQTAILAPFSIRQVIDEVVSLFMGEARYRRLTLDYRVDPEIADWLVGDEELLKRAMINLVGNAVKYTEEGGVQVSVSLLGEHGLTQGLKISVVDTGIGIAPQKRELVFEPFQQVDSSSQRKYGGTGLGLALTKEIIELLQGKIYLEDKAERGSCFSVELWLERPTGEIPVSEPISPLKARVLHSQKKLLVAEDDPVNQAVIQRLLSQMNLQFDLAFNGEEAVRKSERTQYALILMDLIMPELNGFDACKQIKQSELSQNRDTPVIALTALTSETDRERCQQVGIQKVLTKPLNFNELQDVLSGYLVEG
ncbi:MAG: ATP-binding protein [bacterium]|nr:ATP-binding protein [bacterium]